MNVRVEACWSRRGDEGGGRTVSVGAFTVLALLLAVLAAACTVPDVPPPQDGVDVTAYLARINIDPGTLRIYGRTTIDVRHPPDLEALDLGLDWAMAVRRATVNGVDVEAETSGDRIRIPLLGGDSSQVEITYGGRAEEGVFRDRAAGQEVLYTDAWPLRASGWLPAVHAPSDPARFELHLTVPDGYSAVATGVEARPYRVFRSKGGPLRGYQFVLAQDAPVYTFAFAVADSFAVFTDSTASGLPIRHYLLAGDSDALPRLARTSAILDTLSAVLGPYPYAGYSTVQVPMQYAGMENAAAPFLTADMYSAPNPVLVEEVNIHEAVHQWFGNDLVPADWRDLWLAEGFATYLTTEVYARLDGRDAGREQRVRMALLSGRDARRALVPDEYDKPDDMLSATVYQKGGAVLHLLRLTMGEALFFDILRHLLLDYADRPLSTPAFQTVLEQATGDDLDAFFDLWVYGTTIPTLKTTWDPDRRRLSWLVENDEGTLFGVPYEVMVRQDGVDTYVNASDGAVVLPGSERPEVYPVGVLLDVE